MLNGRRMRLASTLLCGVLVFSCSKPNADDRVRKGDEYAAKKQFQEATLEYRAALQIDGNRGDVRIKLGDTYMALRDLRGALGEYVRAADLLPGDANAQVKAGSLLLLARRFEDAKTRATKALESQPKSADAQILLGNSLAGLKDLDGALTEYQEALTLDPAADTVYQNIGTLQLARGKLDEAEAAFRKGVEVAPASVQSRLALANFLWSAGRRPDAEQALKDAVALEPANLTANQALGMFYLASNQLPAAEPYFKTIAATSNTPRAKLALADYYVVARRDKDAKPILEELKNDKDTYAPAMMRLAVFDVAAGSRSVAEGKLHEILVKDPKNMAARLFSARLSVLNSKHDDALTMAQSIVADDANAPQAAGAFELIGNIQAAREHPEEAVKAYQELIVRQPRSISAHLALARLFGARGDIDKASTEITAALALAPKLPVVRAEHVRLLIAQNKTANARDEVASLQREFPNAPEVLKLTALQQLAAHQIDAARVSYAKAVAAAPNDLEALTGLISIDLQKRQTKAAIDRMDAALKALPQSGGLYVLAARTYLATGDADKGETFLKKAIEVDPARLGAYNMLGMLYARQKRLGEAERTFQDIAKRNPSSVGARTMLGLVYEGQNRQPDAQKAYQEALSLDPRAPVAANNLAWIYFVTHGDMTEALRLARLSQTALPTEPNVNDTLGWIYYSQDRFSDAIRYLEIATKNDPVDPVKQFHLGMAYAKFGDDAKARVWLSRAVASKVEFEGIADARKTLAGLS